MIKIDQLEAYETGVLDASVHAVKPWLYVENDTDFGACSLETPG